MDFTANLNAIPCWFEMTATGFPFMLYKMNNCLSNKWDRVYTSEMYKCLLSMPVQDSDATAVVPSITPDFSGSAGKRHFIYPTCSRLSSAASVANTISPCLTFQRHVPVNDSISWNSDESKYASMTDGTTHGYAHPGLASKRPSWVAFRFFVPLSTCLSRFRE